MFSSCYLGLLKNEEKQEDLAYLIIYQDLQIFWLSKKYREIPTYQSNASIFIGVIDFRPNSKIFQCVFFVFLEHENLDFEKRKILILNIKVKAIFMEK